MSQETDRALADLVVAVDRLTKTVIRIDGALKTVFERRIEELDKRLGEASHVAEIIRNTAGSAEEMAAHMALSSKILKPFGALTVRLLEAVKTALPLLEDRLGSAVTKTDIEELLREE